MTNKSPNKIVGTFKAKSEYLQDPFQKKDEVEDLMRIDDLI